MGRAEGGEGEAACVEEQSMSEPESKCCTVGDGGCVQCVQGSERLDVVEALA